MQQRSVTAHGRMGRERKNNFKARFLFWGADSKVAQVVLHLRHFCSKLFSPESKQALSGPRYRSKQRDCRKQWWGSIVSVKNVQSQTGQHCLDLLSSWRSLFLSFSFLICKTRRRSLHRAGMSWGLKAVTEVQCLIQRSLVNCSHHNYFCWKADFNYESRSFKDKPFWPMMTGFPDCLPFLAVGERGGREACWALDSRRASKTDLQQWLMQGRFIKNRSEPTFQAHL